MTDVIQTVDFAILDFLQCFKSEAANALMGFVTHLGDGAAVWLLAAAVMFCTKKYRRCVPAMLLSIALCALLTSGVIKPIVARMRPFEVRNVDILIKPPMGTSFPSGHTSASFAAAVSVFLYNKKEGLALIVLAALIGFSRLYFYVHFPTDVVCGALLGTISAAAVHAVIKWAKRQKANKD